MHGIWELGKGENPMATGSCRRIVIWACRRPGILDGCRIGESGCRIGNCDPGSNHRILRSGAKSRNPMATWSCHRIPGLYTFLNFFVKL